MALQMLDPTTTYLQPTIQRQASIYTVLRKVENYTASALRAIDPTDTAPVEMVVCGDFEDPTCFISNWDVQRDDNDTALIVKFDTSISYNHSTSLYLSSPFDSTRANQRGMSLTSYIEGMTAATVYKIRFWAKYDGNTTHDGGPTTVFSIWQDGNFMTDFALASDNGTHVGADWRLYSFQVITNSGSPLRINIFSVIQNCWIDDIHVVKK